MTAGRTFDWSKAFRADGAISARRIVRGKVGDPQRVAQASGGNLPLIGVGYVATAYRDPIVYGQTLPQMQVLNGEPIDVQMLALAEVDAGATLAPFTWVTADAEGRAIAAGDGDYTIGFTTTGASLGEYLIVSIHPGRTHFGTNVTASPAELNVLNNAPANAAFTIGAEAANVINVSVQLRNADNVALTARTAVTAYLSAANTGASLATAPSGGVAIGTNGLLIEPVADRAFQVVSNASGVFDLNVTDTGTGTFYLALIFPNGSIQVSGAITFA